MSCPIVSIESPNDESIINLNINYAIMALKNETINFNNVAYASHLLNTQTVINYKHVYISDTVADIFGGTREQCIEIMKCLILKITNSLRLKCDKMVFYIDFGYSNGMLAALELAKENKIPYEEKYLPVEMMKYVYEQNH